MPAHPGDVVSLRQQQWRVETVRRDRAVCRIELVNRSGRRTFLLPFDRLDRHRTREPIRVASSDHARRVAAVRIARACGWRSLPALLDADVTIYPHQLELALALAAGVRRVLVADDVGLGKTLQAGLAIAELTTRRPDARVLIAVPPPLMQQWADELRRRFGLELRSGDRAGVDAFARDLAFADNPWAHAGIWVATLDYLKQAHVAEALLQTAWDLVVIDEAHMAAGRTDRWTTAHELGRRARRLVLLTATPHSGDPARFDRLIRLGECRTDEEAPTILRRTRDSLGWPSARHVHWRAVTLSPAESRALEALQAYEAAVWRAAGHHHASARLLLSVFRKRALSTFTALALSLERRMAWLNRQPDDSDDPWRQPLLFDDDGDDAVGVTAESGLAPAIERRWLMRLLPLARRAAGTETKIVRLLRRARATAAPIVVFTEFRDSVGPIAARLQRVREVAVLHGGMAADEQQRAIAAYLDGRATVLVATDVGAQGLNLQHRGRWIVNFELPWNPVRLEQRIGRVDRLGQTGRVHVTLLMLRHPAESTVLRHLAARTIAARRSLGEMAGMWAAGDPSDRIRDAVLTDTELRDDSPPAIAVPVSRAFRRSAQWLARDLIRRRTWRASVPPRAEETGCVLWGRPRPGPLNGARRARTLAIVLVPLLDAAGSLLEQRPVGIVLETTPGRGELRAAIRAARGAAAVAVRPRAARLSRLVQATAARDADIMAQVAEATTAQRIQPGLFDRRVPIDREPGGTSSAGRGIDTGRAITPMETAHFVTIGPPHVVAVVPIDG